MLRCGSCGGEALFGLFDGICAACSLYQRAGGGKPYGKEGGAPTKEANKKRSGSGRRPDRTALAPLKMELAPSGGESRARRSRASR